jgi:hypothetical protein
MLSLSLIGPALIGLLGLSFIGSLDFSPLGLLGLSFIESLGFSPLDLLGLSLIGLLGLGLIASLALSHIGSLGLNLIGLLGLSLIGLITLSPLSFLNLGLVRSLRLWSPFSLLTSSSTTLPWGRRTRCRSHHPSQCPRHRPSFTDSAHHPPVFSLAPADCRGSLTPLYCPWCEAHYTFLGRSNHCLRAPTNNSCPGTSTYMCVVSGTSLGRSNHCQLSPQVRQHNKSFNINQLQSDPICSSQHDYSSN